MSRLFVWDSLVHYGSSWFNLEKTWKNSGKLLAKKSVNNEVYEKMGGDIIM